MIKTNKPLIRCAKDIPGGMMGLHSMPNMSGALAGYSVPLMLTKVIKTPTDDFRTKEALQELNGRGTWQPFGFKQLSIRPEGERTWRWFMIHSLTDLTLQTDDIIQRDGVRYRVMEIGDYRDNGVYEYHVVNAVDAANYQRGAL